MKIFKINKTNLKKRVARVIFVIFLLTTILNFVGCSLGYIGYNYYRSEESAVIYVRPASILVTSNTNTFSTEDLTLDFNIGIYRTFFYWWTANTPREQYAYPTYSMGFAIYICSGQYENSFPDYTNNLRNIENHYFVDEITEDEAFTKEYGYNGFGFNHKRKLNIPSKFLAEKNGSIVIKLATYYGMGELNNGEKIKYNFVTEYNIYIVLKYEKLDDGRIIITNFYKK